MASGRAYDFSMSSRDHRHGVSSSDSRRSSSTRGIATTPNLRDSRDPMDSVSVLRERLLRDVSRDRGHRDGDYCQSPRRLPGDFCRERTEAPYIASSPSQSDDRFRRQLGTSTPTRQLHTPSKLHTSSQTDSVIAPPEMDLSGPEWTESDERAQREAIQSLQFIATRCAGNQGSDHILARLKAAEYALDASVSRCAHLQAEAEQERRKCRAAQEQVMCLEHELDSKEAAVQAVERALERKDADLNKLQIRLLSAQAEAQKKRPEGFGRGHSPGPNQEVYIKSLRTQLDEREQQIQLKDHHITRLLSVMRQHRGVLDEDIAICTSEALSTATTGTGSWSAGH